MHESGEVDFITVRARCCCKKGSFVIHYNEEEPQVYIETTVASHLVARPTRDAKMAAWQRETRRFWHDYANRFEFVTSDVVLNEAGRGDADAANLRLAALAGLTVLEASPETAELCDNLLAAGAIPQNSRSDAEHIAIAAVHGVAYLITWNYKHLLNLDKKQLINEVCEAAGFRPVVICTPSELMEAFVMKETPEKHTETELDFDPATYTNPVLEECYRIKREINAEFKTPGEYRAYLRAQSAKWKKLGWKYRSAPPRRVDNPREEEETEQ